MAPPPAKPVPAGVTVRHVGGSNVWEKRSAHYPLVQVQAVIKRYGVSVFGTKATQGVAAMGLRPEQAVASILALKSKHFFKSMTSQDDPTQTLWQDVYHGPTPAGTAYINFMIFYPHARNTSSLPIAPKLVISFKSL
jgi:hypothetical protein